MEHPKYALLGYDKDNDVYETLCQVPEPGRLQELACIVTDYHLNQKELRRTKTGEPFDWFVTSDATGSISSIFTSEFPTGHAPFD